MTPSPNRSGCVIVMGVSGCGKSTVGARLAEALGWQYLEGDVFHPAANVARMAEGIPLTDADRAGWLTTLATALDAAQAAGSSVVLSCSALRRSYRDVLRRGQAALPFIHLHGDRAVLAERVSSRDHPYMPATLLDSQLATLEMPGDEERVLRLDIARPADALVGDAVAWLRTGHSAQPSGAALSS
jgi:gluconokinase